MSAQAQTSSNEARSAFEKAKSLFPLRDPDPATDEAWELYTSNRLQAPKLLFDAQDEEEYEQRLDIDKEFFYSIGYAMSALEKEMGLKRNVLCKGYRMIACDGYFPDGQERDVCQVIGVSANSGITSTRIFTEFVVCPHCRKTSLHHHASILRPGHSTLMSTSVTVGCGETRTLGLSTESDSRFFLSRPRTTTIQGDHTR